MTGKALRRTSLMTLVLSSSAWAGWVSDMSGTTFGAGRSAAAPDYDLTSWYIGGAVVLVLWIVTRAFRRKAA